MFTSSFRVKSYVWITSFVLCDTDRASQGASQGGLSGTPLIFGGVVANRIGNFYAGVILHFLVSVMKE